MRYSIAFGAAQRVRGIPAGIVDSRDQAAATTRSSGRRRRPFILSNIGLFTVVRDSMMFPVGALPRALPERPLSEPEQFQQVVAGADKQIFLV